MTDRDELAVFGADVVDEVAAAHGLPADRLADVARTHQSTVRDAPGVDNLVYEWRNYFHLDPMLARTDDAYYLAVPDHVWEEFAGEVDADDDELEALRALHDRQARRDAATVGLDAGRFDGDAAIVLVRP